MIVQDAVGDPTMIVTSGSLYRYIGHFLIEFDSNGVISSYDGGRSGILATSTSIVDELGELFDMDIGPMEEVVTLFREYRKTQTIQESFQLVGTTEHVLNGDRDDVRTRETNFGRLVADSTLWGGNRYAEENGLPPVDIAMKNGGGIRGALIGFV
jgi:5'-nucleotidase